MSNLFEKQKQLVDLRSILAYRANLKIFQTFAISLCVLFTYSPLSYAASGDPVLLSHTLNYCEASAKFFSGYSKWYSDTRAIVDQAVKSQPEKEVEINKQFFVLNEKSKDKIFEQVRSVSSDVSSRYRSGSIGEQLVSLLREIDNSSLKFAEQEARDTPGMEKVYYQRKIEEDCKGFILSAH